jgi:hypothetical protein
MIGCLCVKEFVLNLHYEPVQPVADGKLGEFEPSLPFGIILTVSMLCHSISFTLSLQCIRCLCAQKV